MKETTVLLVISWLLLCVIPSPADGSQWVKTIGGAENDTAYCVRQTADGGYVVAGGTASFGAGSYDAWLLKVDNDGTILWQKTYGGSDYDAASSIEPTADGGYIVAGETHSSGTGGSDAWVLKIDQDGKVLWQKTYGGFGKDRARSIQQTVNGGYIVAGGTDPLGTGGVDAWVLKLDRNGRELWQKAYSGSGYELLHSIRQTADGGYIAAGETESFGAGGRDAWVLKLDDTGTVLWQNTYGGSGHDVAHSVQPTADGGYVVAGEGTSAGGGGQHGWVLKLGGNGTLLWQKTYGGSSAYCEDSAYSVQQTADGGYIVAGATDASGAGGRNASVVRLDNGGNILWQKTYGSSSVDVAFSIQQTSDRGYIVAGYSRPVSGNIDYCLLKLDENGNVASCGAADIPSLPVPSRTFSERSSAATIFPTDITPRPAKLAGVSSAAEASTLCFFRDAKPGISVSPANYRFWMLNPGSRQEVPLTISNRGNTDLQLKKWEMTGQDAAMFSIAASGDEGCEGYPFTLAPGKRCTLNAIFRPASIGPRSAVLTIHTNDPDQPALEIPLAGTGIAGKPDLTTSVSVRGQTYTPGETITALSIVANAPVFSKTEGAGFPSGPTTVKFYFSTNETLEPGDAFLGERPVSCLEGDSTDLAFTALTLPAGTASDTYFLLAVVDSDGAIREANEDNNISVLPIRVGPVSSSLPGSGSDAISTPGPGGTLRNSHGQRIR